MVTFLTVLHLLVCVFLIIVVLLQAGKGGGMGIAFGGSGGSQTVFGSSGAGNFLTRLTAVTAFLFLVTSLGLARYSSQQDSKRLQRLAERKADEKKGDDARAAKLKEDLQKARDSAKPVGSADLPTPAPTSSDLPAGATLVAPAKAGLKLDAKSKADAKGAKADDAKAVPAGKVKARVAKPDGDAPTAGDAAEAPKPKKKRHVAPAADGEPGAAPAAPAPPAEAPAAPAP
ncbi:MAG TPA: preprotein translocase subunit SecG [Polyangia bacterium]|jgi:preprotein translocase subunit SecG|nr:preprotein translocase subunit SecG [Polyangia bacterium]